uniref:kinase D-interacting substrate of 220 kDa B-like isoform X1 n=2 Tax=Myxine glutinosa TaxID=7769 RepID=UPI00358F43E5
MNDETDVGRGAGTKKQRQDKEQASMHNKMEAGRGAETSINPDSFGTMASLETYDVQDYEIYSLCLAKTLKRVITPVTVGLYAPWGSGVELLLEKIKKNLKGLEKWPKRSSGLVFLKLIFRMLFFIPVTYEGKEKKNSHFLFVHYNAWEFAGSDRLWAGIITTLVDQVKKEIGSFTTSTFRTVGRKLKRSKEKPKSEWEAKRFLCFTLWHFTLLLFIFAVCFIVMLIILGFPTKYGGDIVSAFEVLGMTLLGPPTLYFFKNVGTASRNIIISQKMQIEKMLKGKDNFKSELGFMHEVKKEVETVTQLMGFIDVFEGSQTVLVILIRNLDRCSPENIVSILEALSILLSEPNSRFVSIFAVDPGVIVNSIKNASLTSIMSPLNGYEILNRAVDFPFCIPKMSMSTKRAILKQLIEGKYESSQLTEVLLVSDHKTIKPFSSSHSENELLLKEQSSGAGQFINKAFQEMNEFKFNIYIPQNMLLMRRIINCIALTIRYMSLQKEFNQLKETISPEIIVAWTMLSTQWPGRLTWILQCLEDEKQKLELQKNDPDQEIKSQIEDHEQEIKSQKEDHDQETKSQKEEHEHEAKAQPEDQEQEPKSQTEDHEQEPKSQQEDYEQEPKSQTEDHEQETKLQTEDHEQEPKSQTEDHEQEPISQQTEDHEQEPKLQTQKHVHTEDNKHEVYLKRSFEKLNKKQLWTFYEDSISRMHGIKTFVSELFVLDGDPERFENFLKKDFKITVDQALLLQKYTVNLDPSMKREMEKHLSMLLMSKRMMENKKNHILTPIETFDMKPNDIIEELSNLDLNETNIEKYKECIWDQHISGKTLLYSWETEICKALNITDISDWASFRSKFPIGEGLVTKAMQSRMKQLGAPANLHSRHLSREVLDGI